MCIAFNLEIPHLGIKPKEIIQNVYKKLTKMMFIKVSFTNKVQLDCPSSLSLPGEGEMEVERPGIWKKI